MGSLQLWSRADRLHPWIMGPLGVVMFAPLAFLADPGERAFMASAGGAVFVGVLALLWTFS